MITYVSCFGLDISGIKPLIGELTCAYRRGSHIKTLLSTRAVWERKVRRVQFPVLPFSFLIFYAN